jgi:hypothetical protein
MTVSLIYYKREREREGDGERWREMERDGERWRDAGLGWGGKRQSLILF